MEGRSLYTAAKVLQGIGLIVVLAGLVMSMQLGMEEEGLKSMAYEGTGLIAGGVIFVVGVLLEKLAGRGSS